MDEQLLRRLTRPTSPVDAVLDTDAYNEIDDQFALAYLLRCRERIRVRGLYAAPFFNSRSENPRDGMEKSYDEIIRLLDLDGLRGEYEGIVYRGSGEFLPSETHAVESDAARHLAALAREYTRERPLYVIAIGAITNVASALLIDPDIRDRIVIVWLGGHAVHWPHTREFNMIQDIAAARVVFSSGAALVQLPCSGVVSAFYVTKPELYHHLHGKNDLCTYLVDNTCAYMNECSENDRWSKVIWDVTAVGWLTGDFTDSRIVRTPIPQYDGLYSPRPDAHPMRYVYNIRRDALMADLFETLSR